MWPKALSSKLKIKVRTTTNQNKEFLITDKITKYTCDRQHVVDKENIL